MVNYCEIPIAFYHNGVTIGAQWHDLPHLPLKIFPTEKLNLPKNLSP